MIKKRFSLFPLYFVSILFLTTVYQSFVLAEPIVLGDENIGQSTDTYTKQYNITIERTQTYDPALALRNAEYGDYDVSFDSLLPFRTPEISPGILQSRVAPKNISSRPFCIIGYDYLSLEWIIEVKPVLVENKAVCFVTNVETKEQLQELIDLLKPVPWQLLHANSLTDQLDINHYPVLVSSHGIEQ